MAAKNTTATATDTARKPRTVKSFDELKAIALRNPSLDSKEFDKLVEIHKMGGAAMIAAATAGMRKWAHEAESRDDDTNHASAWLATVIDEKSMTQRIDEINALLKAMHTSMSVYNTEHDSNLRVKLDDPTATSAPIVGVLNRKRAAPTQSGRTWAKLHGYLRSAGIKSILIPVSGEIGKREAVKLAVKLSSPDSDEILTDSNKPYTVNSARAILRKINGAERQINSNPTHNGWRQCYTPAGVTLDKFYDEAEIAAAEAAEQPAA